MITIKEVIEKSTHFLDQKEVPNPRRQAEDVIATSLCKPRIELYMEFDKPLSEEELIKVRENLKRRSLREPIQYIDGKTSFFNCELELTQDVLIPRQETELLVEKIAECLKNEPLENKVFCDICTGSGAIAIAIKKHFPSLKVIATDLSEKALKIAQKNADKNQVQIEFCHGDLFEPLNGKKVDFIVSNPPYIPESEYLNLDPEVKDYEPKMSLVSGATGLEVYERISKEIKNYLNEGGKAFFEIGYNQGKAVKELFEAQGFDKVRFEKDFSSNDRFFFLELE